MESGKIKKSLTVCLSGWEIENPIIPASGTFGYGLEFAELYDINCLGTFSCKGTTLHERFGNPAPRIAETASGMLNAVGLQNPGVDHVIEHELPALAKIFRKKIIANVSGFSIDEYAQTARKMDAEEIVALLEINVSCPNVDHGGMSFGVDPALLTDVVRAVKAVTKKPVYIKLSPNVTDIRTLALAAEQAGCDGLSLINTFLGMRLDLSERKPVLANRTGGLSGPAIFPLALRMVYDVYEAVHVPIIGMGGVSSADDVLEMMMAGAAAVQIGAANLKDPYACPKILADLPRVMQKYGISDLKEIIGAAHKPAPDQG